MLVIHDKDMGVIPLTIQVRVIEWLVVVMMPHNLWITLRPKTQRDHQSHHRQSGQNDKSRDGLVRGNQLETGMAVS